ncbi:cell cycle control protein cwf8 [Saitoella complicata NRRL Y-17804]|uniref:cell cycle control protein cwf8 n=1 Tax=Saitoella complicata (strain BCRC 22490 / CBS 7301 / JCM 7358 / NBRC 10748 / NRRL Y-17804) TaxID=698492 RepID=UPI000867509F|nr:cell cycle control protein cwf8 [Saitoella complicata NRRL Y-17804]ODQ54383.1 cell cycle control protein cwf8 [Saitoella complicata NRRL Y-17804]
MVCALSGEVPQFPVISSKSGAVFEKHLIESYIAENGKDPLSGEALTPEDLIEVKSSKIVRPRPPNVTSIPALLSVFQQEWDALALETYTLREQLATTRQELSTALYQNDAATRVVARLMKERDEARDALAKINISGRPAASANGGDAMDVDEKPAAVPASVVKKIEETHGDLSAKRKKRKVPADWTTAEIVAAFETTVSTDVIAPMTKCLALDATGTIAIVGGGSHAVLLNVKDQATLNELKEAGSIADAVWSGPTPVTAATNGIIRTWNQDGSVEKTIDPDMGQVVSVALHPSRDFLAAVAKNGTWALCDLQSGETVAKITSSDEFTVARFHPDGQLLGVGTSEGGVQIYDVRTGQVMASVNTNGGAITSLHFSENGYWLAVSSATDKKARLVDLRTASVTKEFDGPGKISTVRWDLSGQFLAFAGDEGVIVQQYVKREKSWREIKRFDRAATVVEWGARAEQLITGGAEGVLTVYATTE